MADTTAPRQDAEFRTLDGITIRGWLFPAASRGPAMIMTPGFNVPKIVNLPDIAKWFQEHGITCFLYDPRGAGDSDGMPRNEVDPRQEVEDLHDAVTWLRENPLVDDTKIALWGVCFGGNITLAATAFDKRVAACVAVAPMINNNGDPERRKPLLELAMMDRAGQVMGEEPMYVPFVDEDGNVPNGLKMAADMMPALERLGITLENRISVQTYYKCLSWNLNHIIAYVAPTPAMMVSPSEDETSPLDDQLNTYAQMGEPKELDILKGAHHMDWIFGDVKEIFGRQFDFLKKHLKF